LVRSKTAKGWWLDAQDRLNIAIINRRNEIVGLESKKIFCLLLTPIGSVGHFFPWSFLEAWPRLSKAWVSPEAESPCAGTTGETPRTPSPTWQILYEIKHKQTLKKWIQIAPELHPVSSARGQAATRKLRRSCFRNRKKEGFGSWGNAARFLMSSQRALASASPRGG
jgi:hypothetical protein